MKKIYIKLLVIILPLLVITPLTFSNKEVKKEKEIAIKEPSLPGGIVAYTLGGEKTNISYNELINSYAVNKITCKNGTNATFNTYDKSISFSNVQIPDYCTIDFNYTFLSKLLSDNPTISTRTDFSTTFTTTNTGTLYKSTESIAGSSAKDVYYFAGDAKNNWVKFAGFYWRIIRTNHDGSVRMLYAGTTTDTTSGYIEKSAFNSAFNDTMYVGYMYGTSGTLASNRTNENNSTIKGVIDTWYSNNLASYTKYISTEAVYCNDREMPSYDASSSFDYYAPYTRLNPSTMTPSYNCTNSKDAFSGNNSEAKLTYPIGLMTADEIAYAGGYRFTNLTSPYAWYYLNSAGGSITGSTYWWLLSPYSWNGGSAASWVVRGSGYSGYLGGFNVSYSYGVRPVISLKGDLIWKSGDGSSASPYEVEDLPPTTLHDQILSDNSKIETRTDFSTTFTTTNTGTLYKSTESIAGATAKDVYYFAGNVTNNWVKFGDFYWRIIRTNHDGSVRLLYSGTATDTTSGYIGISAFNSTYSDPMYVGYMYGTSGTQASNRTNENNSTIKIEIDAWYKNNLLGYTKYLSTEAVYCNDREVGEGTYTTTKSSRFNYASYTRIMTNKKPTYDCTNIKDALSGSNTEAKLTYPIALMTADEIVFAGGKSTTSLISPYAWYYLNSAGESITATTWWVSMSPMFWVDVPYVWYVIGSHVPGSLAGSYPVDYENYGIRPVISIKSDALWSSGNGSSSSPYEIVYN